MSRIPSKQYGLILPNKKKSLQELGQRKLVPKFDSDEELQKSDEETPLDWVDSMMKKSVGNAAMRATQKRHLQEAQKQDPTVFQYDEIYDDMKAETEMKKKKIRGDIDKKPKYIGNILKQTAKRKLENERRMERKVQRERDEEGDEFADKEAFVSASFLKKAQELEEAEEVEKRELALEELRDVTKHKNFGVFYSHILEQTLGTDEVTVKKEPAEKNGQKTNKKNYRTRKDSTCSSSSSDSSASSPTQTSKPKRRRRRSSSPNNSSDSNSSDESSAKIAVNNSTNNVEESDASPVIKKALRLKPLTEEERRTEIKIKIVPRTIGGVFENAVQRFFERKAAST